MLAELLVLAAAAQGLDAIDKANLELTRCGFETHRFANARDHSLNQFERALTSRCAAEMAHMRRLTIAFQIAQKGLSREAATAAADAMLVQYRQHFADGYARRKQSEAQLRALERAILREDKSNAQ